MEIKDSFLFCRAVEPKPGVDQLPGFSEGLLTGHKSVEGERHGSKISAVISVILAVLLFSYLHIFLLINQPQWQVSVFTVLDFTQNSNLLYWQKWQLNVRHNCEKYPVLC